MTISDGDSRDPAGQPGHIHRSPVVGKRVIAQFAVEVISPALDASGAGQGAGVIQSGGDSRHPAAQPDHIDRNYSTITGTVAQCAVKVISQHLTPPALVRAQVSNPPAEMAVTPLLNPTTFTGSVDWCWCRHPIGRRRYPPTLDAPGSGQGAGVPTSSRDGRHPAAQPNHIDRGQALSSGAVTQFAAEVSSPALNAPGAGQGAGVVKTGGNGLHPAAQPNYIDPGQALDRGVIAQLAVVVSSPTPDVAVAGQSAGVIWSRGYGRHPVAQSEHGYRGPAVGIRIITQLAVGVVSPALDVPLFNRAQVSLFPVEMTTTPLLSPTTSTGVQRLVSCCRPIGRSSYIPAPDNPGAGQGTGVVPTGRDGRHPAAQANHIHRGQALGSRVITQSAV